MKSLGLDDIGIKTEGWLHTQIQAALIELLEKKQLYQSVAVDLAPIQAEISKIQESRAMPPMAPLGGMRTVAGSQISRQQFNLQLQLPCRQALGFLTGTEWAFDTEYYSQRTVGHNQGAGPIYFRTPTIKVSCSFCDAVFPAHNSGYPGLRDKVPSIPLNVGQQATAQVFAFPFLCQSCKEHPVVYLVTRRGLKLTLTGKSEFPEVSVPRFIPQEEKDYFSKALVSQAAGHTLAGILYLRVFVEQYLRRTTGAKGKKTGDQLGELYRSCLHNDFPKGFVSLAKVYEELSERLHAADASEEQFTKSKQDLENHFRQLELLPLKKTGETKKA